ncbi:MAG: DUF4157 domain-containing protein, partial [Caldilineaceae bacterium]|nr:DUF4157 domain-containing protein [Caldilineaceae bacterium]
DAATKSVGAAPAPVPMTAEATAHAQPYLARLDRLLDVLHAGAVAFHTVETDLTWQQMNQPDATLIDAQDALGKALTARYKDELLPLLDKPARTARQGDKVEVEPWPALAALKAKYVKAATLVPDYLPYYNSALGMRGQFTQIAVELLRKYKAGKKVSDLRVYLVDQRDNKFLPEIEAWKAMVLDRIRTGQPFNAKQVKDPKAILAAYARQWRRAAGRIVARRRANDGSAQPADGASVRSGLDSPAKPLDAETRAFMEPRFGMDFSRVRVHTDGQAAASAQAMNAQAFTVGDDIVFDEGRYAPQTPAGQELLAHELTHVAQQEGAAPDVTSAAADESRATPAIAFEQIDLPEPAVTDVAMTAALAPAALPAAATTSTPAENAAAATEPPPVTMSQPAAPADGTVAARPVDPATPAPEVVPPSHPSEQEATQVARAVVASAHGPVGAPVVRRKAPRRPQRKPGDKEDKAAGIDVVFIMGVDRNPKRNPFYREAAKYFKAKFPDATLVNDAAHRSLESVFDYVRSRGVRVANLYIVSHANEDGTLSFKLRDGDKDKDPHVQYGDLVRALRDDAARFNLPQGIIDDATNIYIKGCNIGRSSRMLDELDKAFGGAGKVIAPTHKQVFGSKRAGKGSPVEHYEALSTYFIEYKGNQRIAPADQQAAFIEKYPELPEARWKKLVPNTKKGGATRQLVAIPFTYDYGVNVKNAASKRTAQEQALAEAAAWGQENIARTDIFEWRVKSTKLSANGWLVTVVAEKTNYIVDKILVDAAGKRLAPA